MRLEFRKYLHDIQQAATALAQFTEGKNFSNYTSDGMLRAAVLGY
ncbi:MAG: HepT-like ribonuclease domain-containing protein [Gammaproteobacteria bacterium]